MKPASIVVLVLTSLAFIGLVLAEINSRRNARKQLSGDPSAKPQEPTPAKQKQA